MTASRSYESPYGGAAIGVRRYVNEEIAGIAARFDASEVGDFEFVCECGDLSCVRVVTMTLAEFRQSAPGSVVRH